MDLVIFEKYTGQESKPLKKKVNQSIGIEKSKPTMFLVYIYICIYVYVYMMCIYTAYIYIYHIVVCLGGLPAPDIKGI